MKLYFLGLFLLFNFLEASQQLISLLKLQHDFAYVIGYVSSDLKILDEELKKIAFSFSSKEPFSETLDALGACYRHLIRDLTRKDLSTLVRAELEKKSRLVRAWVPIKVSKSEIRLMDIVPSIQEKARLFFSLEKRGDDDYSAQVLLKNEEYMKEHLQELDIPLEEIFEKTGFKFEGFWGGFFKEGFTAADAEARSKARDLLNKYSSTQKITDKSSAADIQKAAKQAIKEAHPDKHLDDIATWEAITKDIIAARDLLLTEPSQEFVSPGCSIS